MNTSEYLDTRTDPAKRIARPKWFQDQNGDLPVTDDYLVGSGIFPLYDERPTATTRFLYTETGFEVGESRADVTWEQVERDLVISKQMVANLVNALRDTKISGGFVHNGNAFQSRQSDRENILGKGYKAQFAVLAGAEEGDLFWDPMTGSNPFVWITADNQLVTRDAYQMVALKDAGETFKAGLTFYARALKDAVLAAADHDALEAIDITAGWPA